MLLDAVAAPVLMVQEQHIVYCNPALVRLVGHVPVAVAELFPAHDGHDLAQITTAAIPMLLNGRVQRATLAVQPAVYEHMAVQVITLLHLMPEDEPLSWMIGDDAWLAAPPDDELQRLRESERRYRIISELISDYAYSIKVQPDGSGSREWLTFDSFERMTGYSESYIRDNPSFNMYHPEDRERARLDLENAMRGRGSNQEYRIITHHGDQRHIQLRRLPVWDDTGQRVIRVYGVAQDITDQKRTEAALRASEQRYRITSELISDYAYSFAVDANGVIHAEWTTRDSFLRMTGYTPEDVDGIGIAALYHPEDRPRVLADVAATLRGEPVAGEYRIRTRQGEERMVRVLRLPIVDEVSGRVVHFYGVAQDITEQKQAEAALRRSEEQYRTLVHHFPSGIVGLFDHDCRFTLLDGEALSLAGMERADIEGHTLLEIFGPESSLYDETHLRAALAGKTTRIEITFREMIFEVRTLPVRDETGRIVCGMVIAQNITERYQMQATLHHQMELQALLNKEKDLSRVKNQLMGTLTHEFRTPLAVISSSVGILERYAETLQPEQRHKRARQIYQQIEHLTEMLDDMAIVLRGDMHHMSFKPERLELVGLCQDIVEHIGSSLGIDHVLNFEPHLKSQPLLADRRLMQRILRNLLSNAIKYSPAGSHIRLSLAPLPHGVRLVVQDAGRGITPQELPHIFETFYRSDSVSNIPGLGLGLGIVRDAVELHRGQIQVDSTPGQGTTFTIDLPAG
ncbi:MAG: PAS domain S-box protein [Anaerolineae bacterium]|nr:PAS domain S-box protein [Anaerolineae bacterium]